MRESCRAFGVGLEAFLAVLREATLALIDPKANLPTLLTLPGMPPLPGRQGDPSDQAAQAQAAQNQAARA